MACKKGGEMAAKNGIAELAKRVPPNQILQFKDFQAKHAEYLTRVNKQPEKLPNIDWEYYRRNVRAEFVKMVNEFEQKYKGVCEAYDKRGQQDKSKYFVEIDKLKQEVQAEVEKYKAESNERIKTLEAKYSSVQALKPYEEMTAEEYCELLPDKSFYMYQGHPSFWPHTEDEQGPGPSSKDPHGHGGHDGGAGGHDGGVGGHSGGGGGGGAAAAATKSAAETEKKQTAEETAKTDKKPNENASLKTASLEPCFDSKQFKEDLARLKECTEVASNDNKNNENSKKAKADSTSAAKADYDRFYIFESTNTETPVLAQTIISAYQSTEPVKPSTIINNSSSMKTIASAEKAEIAKQATALPKIKETLAEITSTKVITDDKLQFGATKNVESITQSSAPIKIDAIKNLSTSTISVYSLSLDTIKSTAKSSPKTEQFAADVKLKEPISAKNASISLATSIGAAQKGGQRVISLIRSESTQANTPSESDKLKQEMSKLAKTTVELFAQIAKVEASLVVRSVAVKTNLLNEKSNAMKAEDMSLTTSKATKQKDISSTTNASTQLKGNFTNLKEVTSTRDSNGKVPKKEERVMSSNKLRQNTLTVNKLEESSGIIAASTKTSEKNSAKGTQPVMTSVRSESAQVKITDAEKLKQDMSELMKYTVEYFGQLAEAEEVHKNLSKVDNTKEDMKKP